MRDLANQLREAFIATRRAMSELKPGMVVQVRIRDVVQKVGTVKDISSDEDGVPMSVTVDDWWMRGKFTAYDGRYTFYEIPPPQAVAFSDQKTEDRWVKAEAYHVGIGQYVKVVSRVSGDVAAYGEVVDVDPELMCVRVVEKNSAPPGRGDMAQEYCHGGYYFEVLVKDSVPGESDGEVGGFS